MFSSMVPASDAWTAAPWPVPWTTIRRSRSAAYCDGVDDVLDGGGQHDDGRAQVGCQVPRLAGIVEAAVVGEDELVVVRGAHGRLLTGRVFEVP